MNTCTHTCPALVFACTYRGLHELHVSTYVWTCVHVPTYVLIFIHTCMTLHLLVSTDVFTLLAMPCMSTCRCSTQDVLDDCTASLLDKHLNSGFPSQTCILVFPNTSAASPDCLGSLWPGGLFRREAGALQQFAGLIFVEGEKQLRHTF